MSEARTTTDHNRIRKWTEERGGHPATVKSTKQGEDAGLLRIDFPGYSGEESLEQVDWDTFFDKFEESHLAFLHQDQTSDGKLSRFCKFVERED